MVYEHNSLGEMLTKKAQEFADKKCIYYYDDTYTYQQFNSRVNRIANSLKRSGIKKGDVVSVCSWNSPDVLAIYFAAHKIGAVAGPVIAEFKGDEIRYVLDNSESVLIFVDNPEYEKVKAIKKDVKSLREVILLGDRIPGDSTKTLQAFIADAPETEPVEQVELTDLAYLFYTAGTTGFPKGVPLTHKNILSYFAAGASLMGGGGGGMTGMDLVFMVILPLFHVNAMMTCTGAIYRGITICLRKRFSASEFWPSVEKYKVNVVSAVPAVYSILLKDDTEYKKYDRSSMFLFITGAAPISGDVIKKFEEKFGVTIIEGYGLTEGTVASTMNPIWERKIGSVGKALPNQEIKIFDDNGRELKPGEVGEIVIRGENVMKGYYKNPEATKEILKDGWLHTGDMGYIDEEGFIFIVGRKKDMLIRGGENIYPKEIENAIYSHDSVMEVAVVGVPDEIMGEEIAAYIAPKPGREITEEELRAWLMDRIADFKIPKYIAFVDSLPKNPVGKVLKRELRELATTKFKGK